MKTRSEYEAEGLQSIIADIKSKGYHVYGPEELTSYVFYTDGAKVAYAQYSLCDGEKYSSVHKPNSLTGSGYQADSIQGALNLVAYTTTGKERDSVVKYKDFETFRAGYWQPLIEY